MVKDQEATLKRREMAFRDRIWYRFEGNLYRNFTEIPSVMEAFPVKHSNLLIEVGAGSGRFTRVFVEEGAEVVVADISRRSLCINKAKTGCQAILADLCHLPFRDSVFHGAAALNVFQYVPSEKSRFQGLREIRRIMREGGLFVIEVYNYRIWDKLKERGKEGFHTRVSPPLYYYRYSKSEIKRLLASTFSRVLTTKPTIIFHPILDTTAVGDTLAIARMFQIFERAFTQNRLGEWAYAISCCVACVCQK